MKKVKTEEEKSQLRISNTSLAWLDISPKYYLEMREKEQSSKESYQIFGEAFHCKVLRPQDFDNEFIISDVTYPANSQQYLFCDLLYQGAGPKDAYLASYKTANKMSAEKLASESSILEMTLTPFVQMKKQMEEKQLLTLEDKHKLDYFNDAIIRHKKADFLINTHKYREDQIEAYNEYEFLIEDGKSHDGQPIYMHGFIDRMIWDFKEKKVYLIELKSTSKPLSEFNESFETYKYHRQLGIYTIAMGKEFARLHPELIIEEFTPEFIIIAAQTAGKGALDLGVFQINEYHIQHGAYDYKNLKERYIYHLEHGYDHPMEYHLNDGVVFI